MITFFTWREHVTINQELSINKWNHNMIILPWLCVLTCLALGLAAGCFKPLPLPMTSYDAAVLAAAASESWRRETCEKRLRLLNPLYVAACYASEPRTHQFWRIYLGQICGRLWAVSPSLPHWWRRWRKQELQLCWYLEASVRIIFTGLSASVLQWECRNEFP